jgi:hypothetical protein
MDAKRQSEGEQSKDEQQMKSANHKWLKRTSIRGFGS